MESLVHNFGNYLEEYVKSDSSKEAGRLIKQIRRHLDDNVEDNTMNFIISKIFDDPNYNFFKFLINIKDKANQKGWREVLSESLEFLNHFLNNFYNKLRPYTSEIIKTCRTISISSAQANEKSKSINILCYVLNHDCDIPIDDITNIYESYFKFCDVHQKTTSAKVQRSVYVLLGIISNKYPYIITNQNNLIDKYVVQLRRQSEASEKDRDNNVVSGCMDGLSNILDTFPVTNEESVTKIYSIIAKLLLSGSTRFDIRDVVKFISKHCSMIIEDIYKEVPELWFETIKKWALLKGENKHAGYVALECFYKELANLLKTKTDERGKKCFHFFFNYFLTTMKDEKADIIEVRLAIRGFGSFSIPCEVHMTRTNLSEMLMIIVNRMEQDYFVQENPTMEQLEYLPDYILCFSTILHQLGIHTFDQIDSLQQISVLMIKKFPELSPIYYFPVFDSLVVSMCYLYQNNPKNLENYLQRVVYQGVLWTCSHRTCFDLTNEDDRTITYKNYLPLWKSLLNFVQNNKYQNFDIDVKLMVVQYIYDELIKTLLTLINKLNLNTKTNDDLPIVDVQTNEAEKIDDFIIFINVVDFYIDLFNSTNNERFKKWIKMYTNQIMTKSSKHPSVSGFYKLLKLGLEISDNYFEESQIKKKEDKQVLYQILLKYLQKTLFNVHEFKDDLQVSCLQLLLTIPLSFVPPLLPTMTPVFEMALIVGRGYLKLAETAVDTLEKWYNALPIEDLKPVLKEVLPNLDPFLRSKGFVGDPDIKLSLLEKKSKRSKTRRKVLIEQDSELANLQNKILMFIGQLDSEMCLYLIKRDVEIDQVTWENHPYLKFTLPYNEVKPNIYLDKLLPRILELALSSGDQKTRITACELLHSIVIFMLGTSRQMSITQSNQMSKLFEKIMLPVIQLGCDSNDVVRQLFNPLAFQMIHWYSSPLQLMSAETSILIDILMEGISHPNNTSVRDLSGKCIKEFVIWTIKQSKTEDLQKNSQNIHVIVNKLCSFSLHPNSYKRLGAALAFNHLYSNLREEQSLIDTYWIELMYSLMISLSLDDGKNNSQLDSALNHIERVLREKNQIFNKHSTNRRIPPGLDEALLKDSVLWILKQTGSNHVTYRRKSIKLFCSLSPYVESNCGSAKNFITNFIDNPNWYLEQYENDLKNLPNLNSWDKLGNVEIIFKWFQYLLKPLDGYKYLLDYNIIEFNTLYENGILHKSLEYFFEYVATKKLNEIIKLFRQFDTDYICLPDEIETFSQLKCTVIIALFDYLLTIIDKSFCWCQHFFQPCFFNFINSCVFQPNIFGFTDDTLSKKITELFNKFCKKLPENYLAQLVVYLTGYFKKNYDKNINLNSSNISMVQRNILKGWLLILNCNLKDELLENWSEYFENTVEIISESLVKDRRGLKLSDTIQEYCDLKLQIAFKLTESTNLLCVNLIKNTPIRNPETNSPIRHGEYFLNNFKESIIEYILTNNNECIKKICSFNAYFIFRTPLKILINILKYLSEKPHLKQNLNMNDLFDNFVYYCSQVYEVNELNFEQRNFQIELLSHIIRLDQKQSYEIGEKYVSIKNWFIQQLNYEPEYETPKTNLQFHTNVLCFLHCVTGPMDDEDIELEHALQSFLNKIFNTSSDKIDNSDLLVLFKKLLDYLIISKSRIVLQSTIDTFAALKYEEENVNIQKALEQYLSKINEDQQYKSIIKVYKHSCTLNAENKYKITKIFLSNLLRFCNYRAFEEFYVQNIKTIIGTLKSSLTEDSDANMIVDKSVNLILIDTLFSRIKIENFNNKSCLITKEMYGKNMVKGNELFKESMKIVNQILKDNIKFDDNKKEIFRVYHCDAFNCLISIVCNTKNPDLDVKGFRLLFFTVKENKNIWKNIIDCCEKISIPQDFDKLPLRKKVFINIRNEYQQKEEKRISYIESQSLFNSTLSEDICKFDFTNTLVRSQDFQQNISNSSTETSIGTVFLKSVDYNNHECMATMCALINHMIDYKISALPLLSDVKTATLPLWMEDLRKVFVDSDESNVRIFIARIIHNTQHIFKYYARFFFESVVKFIVDECTGNDINYFIADLVLMLISWQDNLQLSEIADPASLLIKKLMDKACNDRQDIIKYNLEIIKTSVEIWKTILNVPHEILFNKLQHCNFQEKLVGIHLTGIILANDLIPWTLENIDGFIKSIVTILHKEKYKKITKPAAELLGMILKFLEDKQEFEQSFSLLNKQIDDILRPANIDKLFTSLEQIQIHFPAIIDKHIRKICMYVFNDIDNSLKCICLKNILRRIDNNESKRLTHKDVIDLLSIDDNDVQSLTLQIINKIFLDFKKQHQILVITAVCQHKNDGNSIIRYAVYDVLISVYNTYVCEKDFESLELIKLCKPVLLSALIDSDIELQDKIEQFWYNKYQLLSLTEKYEKFLTDLYSPDIETFYLGCVNYFMLQSCKETPEYKKLMFEYPLSDCKFDDYQVLYNWRLQNASMAPMFSNTIHDFSAPQLVGIRETNSMMAFVPTLTSTNLSASLNTSSGFLFDLNTSQTQNSSRNVRNENQFHNTHGRMFLNEKIRSLGFAKTATDVKIKTEQQRKERMKMKDANIVMYRKYRKGDLPDIQIPYSSIIDPLKILARRDAILARQLYVMLFSGLVNELENSNNFIKNFNEGILSVFNQSYMFVPNVIGAFLDVSFENNKKKNIKKILVDSETLSTVCKNSGLLPIGCLLMEEYISMNDDLPKGSKRGCGSSDDEVKQWVKLADMYKELNEWDAVIGIFSSDQMNCTSEISEAINSEANYNWKEALKKYENLLQTDTDSNRKDFYYESFFKCYSNLSDWENMSKRVTELSDSNFWDADWNQEKLLPWYMTSEMCLMLEGNQQNTIINNLNQWMKENDKSEYLKDKFSEELAILSLLQNDLSASKHYTKHCFGQFLEDWSHLDPLFPKIRSRKLQNFQKVVDLNKYLLHKNSDNLLNYWQRNNNLSSYSLPSTELRILYRQQFINNLEQKFLKSTQDSEENALELKHIKLNFYLNLVENSVENNNYIVGRKYCKESKKYISGNSTSGHFKLLLVMSKIGYIFSEKLLGENKLTTLIESWKRLDIFSNKYPNAHIDLQIESARQIYKITQNLHNFFQNNSEQYLDFKDKIQSLISTGNDFLPDLQNYGIDKLKNAIEIGENCLKQQENAKVLNCLTETYLNLIIFAQNKNNGIYTQDIVKYVLRAMKLGSKEARQIFPCLLQMSDLEGNLLDVFKTESESVPTWMFLLWIPQLLICLNNSTLAVMDVIERIALTYPEALIYTYRLAKQKYDLTSNHHLKNFIEKLDKILDNPLIDIFLTEMSFICIPELYFNYQIEKIIKTNSNCDSIKKEIHILSTDLKNIINQRINFKSIKAPLKSLERDIKDITDLEKMKDLIHKVYDNNKNHLNINRKLKHYSSMLANFKSSDYNNELEIPGQYLGETKPMVKYHAKISSFSQKISCKTKSLRKPLQITIFGNDSKEYSFLVKFGEDLRQDQRIQQLFSLANNILKSDTQCHDRHLFLEQYQVVPLTKSLGLIKIVESTKSLSEFMFNSSQDEENIKKFENTQREYINWIRASVGGAHVADWECYAKACLIYDKNEVNKMFTRCINAVPHDILSKSFWSISQSTSTYTYLRHQFITSYSVMCVVHWLLGIGDRNLGNSLISLRTGRVVGIDFGYAFGATTQHLVIPELIPFRLTPHILAIMEPLKHTGFVDRTMIHCLKALRSKKHLLITTMDVFVKDPSVDWLEFAKSKQDSSSQQENDEFRWYPNEKVAIASQKLNGANSAAITIKELKTGRIPNELFRNAYINVVKGDDSTVRANLDEDGLSEEEQVKCLLDQATDYNILGRQYAGLALWI